MTDQHVAVAVVGGGPSGLTAAAALANQVDGEVLVIERESETGGIPRHSDHLGYGMRDLKRFISGPAYARRLTAMAQDAGAALETEAMVTGWAGERCLQITSPRGLRTVTADAVVLATGARERPRPARLIPGDRPDGVYTTGQLQNLVHVHHAKVGSRALVVGAELVSWSAVLTLREAGCATVGMVSGYPHSEAYAAFRMPGRVMMNGPVFTSAAGSSASTARTVCASRSSRTSTPGGAPPSSATPWCSPATGSPTTNSPVPAVWRWTARRAARWSTPALRTSSPGVFAVGNLLHPVDTADGAALDGRHVAAAVSRWLERRDEPPKAVRIRTDGPFRWVAPQLVSPDGGVAARGDLLFWVDEYRRLPKLRAVQDGRTLATKRTPWPAAPGRVYRAPWSLVANADPAGGDVTVSFA